MDATKLEDLLPFWYKVRKRLALAHMDKISHEGGGGHSALQITLTDSMTRKEGGRLVGRSGRTRDRSPDSVRPFLRSAQCSAATCNH